MKTYVFNEWYRVQRDQSLLGIQGLCLAEKESHLFLGTVKIENDLIFVHSLINIFVSPPPAKVITRIIWKKWKVIIFCITYAKYHNCSHCKKCNPRTLKLCIISFTMSVDCSLFSGPPLVGIRHDFWINRSQIFIYDLSFDSFVLKGILSFFMNIYTLPELAEETNKERWRQQRLERSQG